MRTIITILLILAANAAMAQSDSDELKKAIKDLNTALIKKDTVMLKKLVHDEVTYGHSNGWIETKQDILNDLINRSIEYDVIEQTEPEIVLEGSAAAVRSNAIVALKQKGKPVELDIHIFQAWAKTKTGWQLIGRQSIRN